MQTACLKAHDAHLSSVLACSKHLTPRKGFLHATGGMEEVPPGWFMTEAWLYLPKTNLSFLPVSSLRLGPTAPLRIKSTTQPHHSLITHHALQAASCEQHACHCIMSASRCMAQTRTAGPASTVSVLSGLSCTPPTHATPSPVQCLTPWCPDPSHPALATARHCTQAYYYFGPDGLLIMNQATVVSPCQSLRAYVESYFPGVRFNTSRPGVGPEGTNHLLEVALACSPPTPAARQRPM
jgi:hypothetical protein